MNWRKVANPNQKNNIMTTEPEIPICQICQLPLAAEDILWSRKWHSACEVCQICKQAFPNPKRIQECLDKQITISHITCYDKEKILEVKNKVIPITREHVQALNSQILCMRHTQTGQDSDIELLSALLSDLKELAANVSFVLNTTKDKIRISDSQDYAEKIKTEKKAKAEKAAVEEISKQQRAAERENPYLRDKRKAIEQAQKILGLSLEAATAMVESQEPKGKVQ